MAYRDHIAITSGDKSTTRCEVSVLRCPMLHGILSLTVILATLIVASGRDSGILPRATRPFAGQKRPPGGERERKCCSPLDTDGNLSRSNRDITTYLPIFTTIMRQSSRVNTAQVDTSDGERGP